MKFRLALLMSAGLLAATACGTTSSPATNTSAVQTTELVATEQTNPKSSMPAKKDISASTKWEAVELLWPESPYMVLLDASKPSSKTNGLAFNCNTDTGAISGVLHNQSNSKAGKAASFSLRTSNGEAMTLLGMFARNTKENRTDFVFSTDWRAMKAIANSERVDFVSPEGESVLALVKDVAPHRGDTDLLASSENFDDTQVQLYYYCNPK
ncbi:hypothetical protein [Hirschia maritima]|uniref:hypothetical protein n=1 Tax=Hirschia maritima TaxID=1121961 RepID=UPI00035FE954|nr:hypothetical protein [Hirschia maritima]